MFRQGQLASERGPGAVGQARCHITMVSSVWVTIPRILFISLPGHKSRPVLGWRRLALVASACGPKLVCEWGRMDGRWKVLLAGS